MTQQECNRTEPYQYPTLGPPPKSSTQAVRNSMKGNRPDNTVPERLLRTALWASGIRGYRLSYRTTVGRPDLTFVGKKIAVYVHGCFWHRCPHCALPNPKTNSEFWERKFVRNVERDHRNVQTLVSQGWFVVEIWECEVKRDTSECVRKVRESIEMASTQKPT